MSDVSRLIQQLQNLEGRLEAFDVGVENDFIALDAAWSRLDAAWDGVAYQEFTGSWQQARQMFRQYTSLAYKYEQFLRERIEALQRFERSSGL